MVKRKKIYLIILGVIALLIIAAIMIIFFVTKSDKEIMMYKLNDEIYYLEDDINDNDLNSLKQYVYKCTYKNCGFVGHDLDEKKGIRGNWVLIKDSINEKYNDKTSYIKQGKYYLYNVETEKKYAINLKDDAEVKDIYTENEVPKTLIVNYSYNGLTVDFDTEDKDIVVGIKTGRELFDTNEINYGSDSNRKLRVVNNGYQDFYGFTSDNYSGIMLYDKNFKFIDSIDSLDNFDNEGNIIEIVSKDEKEYFEIHDVKGNKLRSSKMYNNVMVDNGYLIVENNNKLSFMDSKENVVAAIGKKSNISNFTTVYNEYYNRGNGISVLEIKIQNENDYFSGDFSNVTSITQYFYNLDSKKIEIYKIDIEEINSIYEDLTKYYSNGYYTSKKGKVNIYIDTNLSKEYKEEFNNNLNNVYNKFQVLFESESNIYVYTRNNYEQVSKNYPAWINEFGYYTGAGYSDKNIIHRIFDNFPRDLVSELSYKLYDSNKDKYNNKEYKKIFDKYSSNFGYDINNGERLFFGLIMKYYYYNNINNCIGIVNCDSFINNVNNDVKNSDEFSNDIANYIEKYVIK